MARFAARQIQQAPTKKIERVLLINPYPYYAIGINEATVYPPLGLASIAAYL
jgi:hypothetical protein